MMTNDLIKPDNRKDLSTATVLYLLNLENGRVFPWTTYLSVKKGFIDCDEAGRPIKPSDVPGDHPWILEQTKGLRARLSDAGADGDTLYQVGQQLTEDGNAKFKALEYKESLQLGLDKSTSAADTGFTVRINNKIEKRAEAAHKEIRMMVVKARIKLGL